MPKSWYLKNTTCFEGPLSFTEIKQRANSGKINPDTVLRLGTKGKCIVAGNIQGLFLSAVVEKTINNSGEISHIPLTRPEIDKTTRTFWSKIFPNNIHDIFPSFNKFRWNKFRIACMSSVIGATISLIIFVSLSMAENKPVVLGGGNAGHGRNGLSEAANKPVVLGEPEPPINQPVPGSQNPPIIVAPPDVAGKDLGLPVNDKNQIVNPVPLPIHNPNIKPEPAKRVGNNVVAIDDKEPGIHEIIDLLKLVVVAVTTNQEKARLFSTILSERIRLHSSRDAKTPKLKEYKSKQKEVENEIKVIKQKHEFSVQKIQFENASIQVLGRNLTAARANGSPLIILSIDNDIRIANERIKEHQFYCANYEAEAPGLIRKLDEYTSLINNANAELIVLKNQADNLENEWLEAQDVDGLIKRKEWEQAVMVFKEWIMLNNESPTPYNMRGMAYLQLGKIKESNDDFKKARDMAKDRKIAEKNLAEVRRKWKDLNKE